ncbi:MAG: alpha/beta hydrolase [Kofleriaceae bacterium]
METKTVTANGLAFAYLEQGSGPLVLFVHGFPDTAHTWDASMAAVAAAGYRAVAVFTRGYHPTEVPADGDYATDTLGKDLLALIPALGAESAVLVGHDWGAVAAYAAAAMEPKRVRLLVTLAIPHPRGVTATPSIVWALRHFFVLRGNNAATALARDDFKYVDTLWQRWSKTWSVPAAETAAVKAAFRQPGSAAAACGYYRANGLRLAASHKLPITVPAVAFAGVHDLITPRVYEKARHCFTGSYEVVQVPGGHFMHREHPDHFIPELVRVISDHDRVR